jgi:PAS domain-containing protein
MPSQPLELILARQFGDSLNMPIFLVDPEGNLLFYNEPAEEILGLRYSETGGMRLEEWTSIFKPIDIDGNPMPPEQLPLVKTLTTKIPASGSFYIDSKKGERFLISVTAIPIVGRADRYSGAMALFWKTSLL